MTATGRPWDELEDTLTWPRLTALTNYWVEHPPIHELAGSLAALVGVRPKERQKQQSSIEEIMGLFQGGVLK